MFDHGAITQIQAAKSINQSLFAFADVATLKYHPNGSRKSIAHGDGTVDETQLDASDRIQNLVFSGLSDCVTPSVSIAGTLSVPSGASTTLSAVATFPPDYQTPVTYQWYASNSPAPDKKLGGQTQATLAISSVTSSVNYWVVIQTSCAAVTSAAVTVSVCVTPTVSITGTLSVPSGTGTTLSAAVSSVPAEQGPVTYQWYASSSPAPDKKLAGQTQATLAISSVTSSVNYWVVIQTTCTSVTSSTVTVSVVESVAAPTGLQANRVGSTSSIQLTWNAVSNAAAYAVERRTAGDTAFYEITTSSRPTSASYTDGGCPAGNVCVYRVRAVTAGGTISSESNKDLAGLLPFSTLAGGTLIDLDHFNEILNAVNQVRAASGQTGVTWSGILPGGVPVPALGGVVRAAHVTSLRDAMDTARSLAGVPNAAYTDALSFGVAIRALHLTELQERTK